jgi:hypothetical protein
LYTESELTPDVVPVLYTESELTPHVVPVLYTRHRSPPDHIVLVLLDYYH